MRFQEAFDQIMVSDKETPEYLTHAYMVSERKSYVRYQGEFLPLKFVNFKTGLEQDWVPSAADLMRDDWQILEDK